MGLSAWCRALNLILMVDWRKGDRNYIKFCEISWICWMLENLKSVIFVRKKVDLGNYGCRGVVGLLGFEIGFDV